MDFMLALNVTIYGLGIVFLALLVLMVAIMILTKIFAVATHKDLLEAQGLTVGTAAPVPAQTPSAHPPTAAEASGSAAESPLPPRRLLRRRRRRRRQRQLQRKPLKLQQQLRRR